MHVYIEGNKINVIFSNSSNQLTHDQTTIFILSVVTIFIIIIYIFQSVLSSLLLYLCQMFIF